MPSPFPGMNPYLEQPDAWSDFHSSFLIAMRDTLVVQVSPEYIAKVEQQLYIHEPPAESRRLLGRSDVSVAEDAMKKESAVTATSDVAPAEVTLLDIDVERLRRIEIRDRMRRQLITVIEMLSPTNKYAGADRDQYEAKRGEILASHVHFVEIDLLRGGPRMPSQDMPRCDYCVLVSRYRKRPKAEFWPIQLRDRLPRIPIPLREGDSDASVDLQELLHQVYDKAGYRNYIYANAPEPALSKEDAAWAEHLLAQTTPT